MGNITRKISKIKPVIDKFVKQAKDLIYKYENLRALKNYLNFKRLEKIFKLFIKLILSTKSNLERSIERKALSIT
jgi:regulator of sigma D